VGSEVPKEKINKVFASPDVTALLQQFMTLMSDRMTKGGHKFELAMN
jgi:hypothetical protein